MALDTWEQAHALKRKVGDLSAELAQNADVVVHNVPTRGIWWESLRDLQRLAGELEKLCDETLNQV